MSEPTASLRRTGNVADRSTAGPAPEVDIVIVSYNTETMTLECVQSISDIVRTEGIAAQIWLVDNASKDDTVASVKRRHTEVRVIANPVNAGFSVANNLAIRQGSGRFVLLLNSDAFLHAGALTSMLDFLSVRTDVSAVGPRLFLRDGDVQHSAVHITTPFRQLLYLGAFHAAPLSRAVRWWFRKERDAMVQGDEARVVPLLSAACLLCRRDVFDAVGLLPEDRFLYSEEDDLFLRMRRAGMKSCYLPQAKALHICGASTQSDRTTVKRHDYFHESRLRYLHRHFPNHRRFVLNSHRAFFAWSLALAKLRRDAVEIERYRELLALNRTEYERANRCEVLP